MRIIILRHGLRGPIPTFLTSLTEEGFIQVNDTALKLKKINIDEIYCSPFLRTVQTIYPYCEMTKKKIKIENGIYESTHSKHFNLTNFKCTPEKYRESHPELFDIIDSEYESFLNLDEIICNENFYETRDRVFKFINHLIKIYEHSDKNILLVTHMAVCNLIKRYFNNKTELNDVFEMADFEIIVL